MGEEYKRHKLRENNGRLYPFKARPYDDANYYYALSTDGGNTWIIAFDGKKYKTITGDWKTAVDLLEELNANIKPKILYD